MATAPVLFEREAISKRPEFVLIDRPPDDAPLINSPPSKLGAVVLLPLFHVGEEVLETLHRAEFDFSELVIITGRRTEYNSLPSRSRDLRQCIDALAKAVSGFRFSPNVITKIYPEDGIPAFYQDLVEPMRSGSLRDTVFNNTSEPFPHHQNTRILCLTSETDARLATGTANVATGNEVSLVVQQAGIWTPLPINS